LWGDLKIQFERRNNMAIDLVKIQAHNEQNHEAKQNINSRRFNENLARAIEESIKLTKIKHS
jgi:hypothetical protein